MMKMVIIIIPSEHLTGDARGVVGNFPTTTQTAYLLKVGTLLEENGTPWRQPPSRTQEVFDELRACMGAAALANYGGSQWWGWCADPETRVDVLEAHRHLEAHPDASPAQALARGECGATSFTVGSGRGWKPERRRRRDEKPSSKRARASVRLPPLRP